MKNLLVGQVSRFVVVVYFIAMNLVGVANKLLPEIAEEEVLGDSWCSVSKMSGSMNSW